MIHNKTLHSTLFRKSDDKTSMKSQRGPLSQRADQLISKGKKATEKSDQKLPRLKQEDKSAVSKLLNNIKSKKENQFGGAQKDLIFNFQKSKKTIIVAEPIEIESSPQISVELLYNKDYGDEMEEYLYTTMPDFSNSLKNTAISEKMRAIMVNWMIEVLANYNQTTSNQTLFLSVAIMDMYFKHSKVLLQDSDVHLSGICAMFLASKYCDIYHIPLVDIVKSVGHNKFSSEAIKQKEWEIVSTLDFTVNIPTYLDYLGRIIYNNFHEDACDEKNLESIRGTSVYVLKMCLHHYEMIQFSPKILAYSVLCYTVKCLFNDLVETSRLKNLDVRQIQMQEANLLKSILYPSVMNEIGEIQRCTDAIKELTLTFSKRYPTLTNIDKFCDYFNS